MKWTVNSDSPGADLPPSAPPPLDLLGAGLGRGGPLPAAALGRRLLVLALLVRLVVVVVIEHGGVEQSDLSF